MLNEGIIYTNDNCQGCNRCILVCPVLGANQTVKTEDGNYKVLVDEKQCIQCGECLVNCNQNAREYRDDTESFLKALKRGEQISLLVAPSFMADYPDTGVQILGYLKHLGVKEIFDVSAGADITTWAYINYIQKYHFVGGISQPCAAVVNYIEQYKPDMINKLIPIQSPVQCLAIYLHKYLQKAEKFAFLSPCIAKKQEIESKETNGQISYNVTFKKLMEALKGVSTSSYSAQMEECSGIGYLYPAPGGLKENVEFFLGKENLVRQIEGSENAYQYLRAYEDKINTGKQLPFLTDILNCQSGCLYGTGTEKQEAFDEAAFFSMMEIRNKRNKEEMIRKKGKKQTGKNPYDPGISEKERLVRLNEKFQALKLEDFIRNYNTGRKVVQKHLEEKDYQAVFNMLHKHTYQEQHRDCGACGYSTCMRMAKAIFNGYNHKENCVNYMKYEIAQEKNTIVQANENMKVLQKQKETVYKEIFETFDALNQSIVELAGRNEKNAGKTQDISKAIGELQEFSVLIEESMKEITDFIDDFEKTNKFIVDISGKTNMLSLNASIEAARSGEAGRGFAIIANQVKVLSDKTKQAVEGSKKNSEKLLPAISELKEKTEQFIDIIKVINERTKSIAAAQQEIAAQSAMIQDTSVKLTSQMEKELTATDETVQDQ